MQRIVALDIGSVRIGVAVSDPLGMFAQGLTVLDASKDWLAELEKILLQYENPIILVGLPLRTDGSEGPEAQRMHKTADRIKAKFPSLALEFWDERFTTTIAQHTLLEGDVSRAGRKKRVDKIAATLLLESYLEGKRN